ncbi:hypothetical protein MRB53_005486 [Persea americana]|uniref:Uncharacterized protein n=1 Tax=Persea americana TaxID=3435 RepID=A0ACC2MEA7_PERAE|nr:hypothetical protein MRB53_005486 [Persea americana]
MSEKEIIEHAGLDFAVYLRIYILGCIAVTTTLPIGALQEAGPSLIRKDIGNVSLHVILSGCDSGSRMKPKYFFLVVFYCEASIKIGERFHGLEILLVNQPSTMRSKVKLQPSLQLSNSAFLIHYWFRILLCWLRALRD